MPEIFDIGALARPAFEAADFTATKWDGANAKAKFANNVCRFISADFKESQFTKPLYGRLALCFGHIAHYDKWTFYDHFFRDLRGKVAFLEETLAWQPCGDPQYTYCDVEHAVQARLRQCDLLTAYRARRAAEIEGAERELLRRLQAKYAEPSAPIPTPVLHSPSPPRPLTASRKPDGQPTLF